MTIALEGEGSASRPGRSLPPGKTRCSLYRRLGGFQGRSEQVRKISPPPRFDPRIVQPVASRYTDCATRPTDRDIRHEKDAVRDTHRFTHDQTWCVNQPSPWMCIRWPHFAQAVGPTQQPLTSHLTLSSITVYHENAGSLGGGYVTWYGNCCPSALLFVCRPKPVKWTW